MWLMFPKFKIFGNFKRNLISKFHALDTFKHAEVLVLSAKLFRATKMFITIPSLRYLSLFSLEKNTNIGIQYRCIYEVKSIKYASTQKILKN